VLPLLLIIVLTIALLPDVSVDTVGRVVVEGGEMPPGLMSEGEPANAIVEDFMDG